MKNFFAVLSLSTSLSLAVSAADMSPLSIGSALPSQIANLKMKDAHTKTKTSIHDVKGKKGTLVVFISNQCPVVRKYSHRMIDTADAYKKKGVGVVFVNSNDAKQSEGESFDKMQALVKDWKIHNAYVADESQEVAHKLGASRTPEFFLFDSKDKLIYTGAFDDSPDDPDTAKTPYLKTALDALLANRALTKEQATSRAVGCGITYRKT